MRFEGKLVIEKIKIRINFYKAILRNYLFRNKIFLKYNFGLKKYLFSYFL